MMILQLAGTLTPPNEPTRVTLNRRSPEGAKRRDGRSAAKDDTDHVQTIARSTRHVACNLALGSSNAPR